MDGFFLTEKEGRFTDRDEAVLVLLAAAVPPSFNREAKRVVAGLRHRTVAGGGDGSEAALAGLPVIFISAYGRSGDIVAKALEAGAADNIVKPFSPAELVARIKMALRRRTGPGREPLVPGDLATDYEKRRVPLAGCPVCRRRPRVARCRG